MIDPLYSRCVVVRCSAPTEDEIMRVLQKTNKDVQIPDEQLRVLASSSERNLILALRYMELFRLRWLDSGIRVFRREEYDSISCVCASIVDTIVRGADMEETIDAVREQIYDLMTFCVNCQCLIPTMLGIAISRLPKSETDAIHLLCQYASQTDETIRTSSKPIYHVEYFCLKMFAVIKGVIERRKQERVRIPVNVQKHEEK